MNLTNLNLMIYHADLQPAQGIISRAFFLRKNKKRLSTKALETAYGRVVYPTSQILRSVCQEPFLTSYAEHGMK